MTIERKKETETDRDRNKKREREPSMIQFLLGSINLRETEVRHLYKQRLRRVIWGGGGAQEDVRRFKITGVNGKNHI